VSLHFFNIFPFIFLFIGFRLFLLSGFNSEVDVYGLNFIISNIFAPLFYLLLFLINALLIWKYEHSRPPSTNKILAILLHAFIFFSPIIALFIFRILSALIIMFLW
jgi:hypothetical protein